MTRLTRLGLFAFLWLFVIKFTLDNPVSIAAELLFVEIITFGVCAVAIVIEYTHGYKRSAI